MYPIQEKILLGYHRILRRCVGGRCHVAVQGQLEHYLIGVVRIANLVKKDKNRLRCPVRMPVRFELQRVDAIEDLLAADR